MAITIVRTAWVDDDGTGTTGTVINNAVKSELYNQIDGAFAQVPAGAVTTPFTPTLLAGGAATSPTYVKRTGSVTTIGKLAFVTIDIALSNLGAGSGPVTITGMPVTPSATRTVQSGSPVYYTGLSFAFSWLSLAAYSGNTTLQFLAQVGGGGVATATVHWSHLSNVWEMYGTLPFVID